jgi:uncharacterized protein YtpQ (UPF0354 family)
MFETLIPIIVPRTYFKHGNWPGHHLLLRHPELAVTWVELGHRAAMMYVDPDRHDEIERAGHQVHQLAMENLRRMSTSLSTHSKGDGDRYVFHAMMHPDGLGTSRLLLLGELDRALPQGYWLGIPERSCGVIVPKDVTAAEREDAIRIIGRCHQDGTTPMLPGLVEREMFELLDASKHA